jgi:hypothetical protein
MSTPSLPETPNPLDPTFGTDPMLDGINKDDPLSTLPNNTGGSGSDDLNQLPTGSVGEELPPNGVQNIGGSDFDELPESSSSSQEANGESEKDPKVDPLTNEPLNSDPSSVLEDTEGDPLIDPGGATDDVRSKRFSVSAPAADDPTDGITDNPTENSSDDPTENSSDDSTDDEAGDPTENSSDDPTENSSDDSTENSSDDSTENSSDDSTENSSDDSTENSSDDSTENSSDDSTENSSDDSTENSSDDSTENSSDDSTENSSDDSTDDEAGDFDNLKPNFDIGSFKVDATGKVGIDFLFDGGGYKGELAIFSLEGMEEFSPGSEEFIFEAARRALSSSELGHVVISDQTEGARFTGELGEGNQNYGDYLGVKTFNMRPGDTFAVMMVPAGRVQKVYDNPGIEGASRPLFSLATINPDDAYHVGQIADVTGDGSAFAWEDLRVDGWTDKDYNDIVFQVRGAKGTAALMDDVVKPSKDWRDTDMGKALIEYAKAYITPELAADEVTDDAR